jgi:hypothetical protein
MRQSILYALPALLASLIAIFAKGAVGQALKPAAEGWQPLQCVLQLSPYSFALAPLVAVPCPDIGLRGSSSQSY